MLEEMRENREMIHGCSAGLVEGWCARRGSKGYGEMKADDLLMIPDGSSKDKERKKKKRRRRKRRRKAVSMTLNLVQMFCTLFY